MRTRRRQNSRLLRFLSCTVQHSDVAVKLGAVGSKELELKLNTCRTVVLAAIVAVVANQSVRSAEILATKYPSLQAAIDANPGQMIYVPQGEYVLEQPLQIVKDGTGLYGFGEIVQPSTDAAILRVAGANDVRIQSLTFRRTGCKPLDRGVGISVEGCDRVVLDGVRLRDHEVQGSAIMIRRSSNCTVRNCEIVNYKQIAVDDRTHTPLQGYAFMCIDGTGISVKSSTGTIITGNRIVDEKLFPTREMQDRHNLGTLVPGRRPTQLGELGKRAVQNGNYVDNWHQGSAIIVTDPRASRQTLISDNYIQNANQGVDMHCDNLVCSNNVIRDAGIGLKATHGCRNVIMTGNLLTQIDRWGILVNPGANSSKAEPAKDDRPHRPANVDGGIVIANNIVTEYGGGHEYWHLGGAHDDRGSSYGIALLSAQLATNPPLRDILIQGNIVYDTMRDEPGTAGENPPKPKYRYAVFVEHEPGKPAPRGIHFKNNVLHPGSGGVSNVEIGD